MDADGPSKKLRKPYTITKIRDRWTEEEHDRFLEALLLYGRDWKKVEGFIGTKTVIQIRSHAQKYFLKVQKKGMMAHVPPPRPKRKAAYPCAQKVTLNMAEIYRFIGNMVDPVVRYPLGIYLQKLKETDPIVVKLVLRMMKNLTNNLSSPHFEMLQRNLLMADGNYRIIKAIAEATAPAELIENITMAPYVGL